MDRGVVQLANEYAAETGAKIGEYTNSFEAVANSDIV